MNQGIKYIIDNADAIWESVAKTKSTRGTLLHSTKLPKWKWLVAIYQVANIKNISVRELAGTISVNRNTAWKLLQKIRYSIPQEDIKLIGETIIDETYIGGWKNKHLSYKWDYMRRKGFVGQHPSLVEQWHLDLIRVYIASPPPVLFSAISHRVNILPLRSTVSRLACPDSLNPKQ